MSLYLLCQSMSKTLICASSLLGFQDIATRVISQEINVEETSVSKVMTRNPMFVLSETLAVEALQKMVLGLCVCLKLEFLILVHGSLNEAIYLDLSLYREIQTSACC